jgi:hypothetical protein
MFLALQNLTLPFAFFAGQMEAGVIKTRTLALLRKSLLGRPYKRQYEQFPAGKNICAVQ